MSDRCVQRRFEEALYRSNPFKRSTMSWVPDTDDSVLKWGNGTLNYDIWLYGNTASDYFLWDASASKLSMEGAAVLNVPAGQLQIAGTAINATAAEINAVADVSARLVTVSTTASLTATTHAGKIVTLTGTAAHIITLPAASGTGNVYTLLNSATVTGNLVIQVANTNDVMTGTAVVAGGTTTAATEEECFATASTSDTMTLDGTTKGGITGGRITIVDVATNKFHVTAILAGSGVPATPFSAAV